MLNKMQYPRYRILVPDVVSPGLTSSSASDPDLASSSRLHPILHKLDR